MPSEAELRKTIQRLLSPDGDYSALVDLSCANTTGLKVERAGCVTFDYCFKCWTNAILRLVADVLASCGVEVDKP